MGFVIRRSIAALRKFKEDHEFWKETKLFVDSDGTSWIEVYYQNEKELAGIWHLRYEVLYKCLRSLQAQDLIVQVDEEDGTQIFELSAQGKKRLTS